MEVRLLNPRVKLLPLRALVPLKARLLLLEVLVPPKVRLLLLKALVLLKVKLPPLKVLVPLLKVLVPLRAKPREPVLLRVVLQQTALFPLLRLPDPSVARRERLRPRPEPSSSP
jgi:hypothetical protein